MECGQKLKEEYDDYKHPLVMAIRRGNVLGMAMLLDEDIVGVQKAIEMADAIDDALESQVLSWDEEEMRINLVERGILDEQDEDFESNFDWWRQENMFNMPLDDNY